MKKFLKPIKNQLCCLKLFVPELGAVGLTFNDVQVPPHYLCWSIKKDLKRNSRYQFFETRRIDS